MVSPSIYDYVKSEEARFESEEIKVADNWWWNFRNHVQLIFQLKNSIFATGVNDWLRAFKNIIEPILNLAFWAEDIEVKDIVFFIEEQNGRALSFLVKKYHDEVYVKENNIDTVLDEITESDLEFGGVLVQDNDGVPEVIQLNTIAFCDQTDIMGAPIAFKFHFSPDKLRSMSKNGWGSEKNGATITLDELCILASNEKNPDGTMVGKMNRTTGKDIEVYIIRGSLPEHYLKDNDNMEDWYNQVHVIAYYTNSDNNKNGVTLYRAKETGDNLLFFTSKKVYGRALGRGQAESLLHPQVWTNFLTIHKMNLLETASKVPLYTDDADYSDRQKIQGMENLEITRISSDSKYGIRQIPTAAPANIQLMEKTINEWYEQAQLAGSAFDPLIGKESASGTTFRGQERTVAQGRGLHDRRRGQRAKFIEEIYRKIIIPDIKKKILKGKKFLASLSTEEMQWVAEQVVANQTRQMKIDFILENNGLPPPEEVVAEFERKAYETFKKKGTKQLIEILKGEFNDVEIKMGINVAGKQKNLADLSDKILNVVQFAIANPQAIQNTGLSKPINDILEFSGLSPVDFAMLATASPTQTPIQAPQTTPQAPPLALNTPQTP